MCISIRVRRHFETLQSSVISKLLDSISSGLHAAVEAINRDLDAGETGQDSPHRLPLEIYAFLLQWFCTAAERHTPNNGAGVAAPSRSKAKVSTQCPERALEYVLMFPNIVR